MVIKMVCLGIILHAIILLDCYIVRDTDEKEILWLNSAIESLKDNQENEGFIDFLLDQKKSLEKEISANKKHIKETENATCYSDIFGSKVDPPVPNPKSGIDYKKAYETNKGKESNKERKKNEQKMDE